MVEDRRERKEEDDDDDGDEGRARSDSKRGIA